MKNKTSAISVWEREREREREREKSDEKNSGKWGK